MSVIKGALLVPQRAVTEIQGKYLVAVVGADEKVSLKPVTVARDLGSSIEIGAGLAANDRVIDSPPDGISDGDPVRVKSPEAPRATR